MPKNAQSFFWAFFLFFSICCSANAAEEFVVESVIDKARQLKLAQSETWGRLLHIEEGAAHGTSVSSVLDTKFFLTADSVESVDRERELLATIRALFSPAEGASNVHAQCQYPARSLWLLKQTDTPSAVLPDVDCDDLHKWVKPELLRSVSLMMVTGYFGNPASSFGHIMLKVNNGDSAPVARLLDEGVNYGAAVPENESMLVYILKGIFGGYRAEFTTKPFYNADQVYTRTEFRDMWEYELDLSQYQQMLFLYHVWELTRTGFVYYFADENCAYRLAELLELVTGYRFTPKRQFWYAPISVFTRLHQLERMHGGLIKRVTFVPSSQREAYSVARRLSKEQRSLMNTYIQSLGESFQIVGKELPVEARTQLLDMLLMYYSYKAVGLSAEEKGEITKIKTNLLSQRFELPPGNRLPEPEYIGLNDPGSSPGPSRLKVAVSEREAQSPRLEISYSPYFQDLLRSRGDGMEFSVADFVATVESSGRVRLKEFTLLSLAKAESTAAPFIGERDYSWRAKLGTKENAGRVCDFCTSAYATAGVGLSWQLSGVVKAYGFADAYMQSRSEPYGMKLVVGSLVNDLWDKVSAQLEMSYVPRAEHRELQGIAKLNLLLQSNIELTAELETADDYRFGMGVQYRW